MYLLGSEDNLRSKITPEIAEERVDDDQSSKTPTLEKQAKQKDDFIKKQEQIIANLKEI